MIQLANDPRASRSFRPGDDEGKDSSFDPKRNGSGHAWPFLSRDAAQPQRQHGEKPAARESVS